MGFYCDGKKGICNCEIFCDDCTYFNNSGGEEKQTNADRIRAMSDEELADWIARTQIANVSEALTAASIPFDPEDGLKDDVEKDCLEWLRQPADTKEK